MYNVFEDVLEHRAGDITAIKSTLLGAGAEGSVMSGTGSAVFGLFTSREHAENAAAILRSQYRETFLTRTIGRLDV